MTYNKYLYSLISLFLYFTFFTISADEACDISKCKGPLEYYRDIKCTPIYSSEDNCCPIKYNCDNLKGRSKDKCYINSNVYELNEKLKEEDAKPCDINCTCLTGYDEIATFNCAIVDCFQVPVKFGCYRKESLYECCSGKEVCPKNSSDIPKCEVDGKIYRDSEYFTPKSDPTLNCICAEGYTGKNVEPFCKATENSYCGAELRGASNIHNNCTPVYYATQNPATDCSVFSRCQNDNDEVVKSPQPSNDSDFCIFGNLTMNKGDELNQATDYNSVCVKCVCEVPPLPTCQRVPDNDCDITKNKPFQHFEK